MGGERLARPASRRPIRSRSRSCWPATTETTRYLDAQRRCSRCARRASCRRFSTRSPSKDARSRRCACSRWPTFSIRSTKRAPAIRRAPGSFPLLEAASGGAASFKGETGADAREDRAVGRRRRPREPRAARLIRERLRKQRTRLRGTLESYLRGKETAKYLQDQVVTERNGRYVLVVKAEHRSAIPGIVHGASTSGASLFLEPLSTVEINNDIVALEEQEAEEVRRILLALTDAFRARARPICSGPIEAATELDVLQARARVLRVDRRRRAGALDRRRVRAAGGAASAASKQRRCRCTIKIDSAGDGACWSPARTPAARRWR